MSKILKFPKSQKSIPKTSPWFYEPWVIRLIAVIFVLILAIVVLPGCSSKPTRVDQVRELVKSSYYMGCLDNVIEGYGSDPTRVTARDRHFCNLNASDYLRSLEK